MSVCDPPFRIELLILLSAFLAESAQWCNRPTQIAPLASIVSVVATAECDELASRLTVIARCSRPRPWVENVSPHVCITEPNTLGSRQLPSTPTTAIVAYSPLGRGLLTGAFAKKSDIKEGDWRASNPRFQGGVFACSGSHYHCFLVHATCACRLSFPQHYSCALQAEQFDRTQRWVGGWRG